MNRPNRTRAGIFLILAAVFSFATLLGAMLFSTLPDHWSAVGMVIVGLAGLATAVLQALEQRAAPAVARKRPADEADVPLSD